MRVIMKSIIGFTVFILSTLVSTVTTNATCINNLPTRTCVSLFDNDNFSSNQYLSLDKLPKEYGKEVAIKYGDVVGRWGEVFNIEKFYKFIEAYENKTLSIGDMIRITTYSIEGNPLIKDLILTEEGLRLIIDDTRAIYGKPEIVQFKVSNIFNETRNHHISYVAKTTTDNNINLISIGKTK